MAATKKIAVKTRGKAAPATKKSQTGAANKAKRSYPSTTLLRCLQIAQKIKELNGGNSWTSSDVAAALDMGAKSSNFFYLTAASRDFGLTTGTRDTDQIALADMGREIVYAASPEVERSKQIEAFLNVPIFKQVLDHYKGSALPEMKYLGNTLERDFKLAPEFHEEFSRLFRENCEDLGISSGGSSNETVGASPFDKDAPTTLVLGQPKKSRGQSAGLKVFIIMPFVERNPERQAGFFAEVLRSLLTPAGIEAGFIVETANRQGSDVIQSTIINELLEADLVIADLTDHNPNVLFELGLRMAEDKPVALVKASGTGRIFDVDNMLRVYEYNANLWNSTIDKDLPNLVEHVKAAWETRDSDQSYMKILRRLPAP
jgi:hypothetical protein